MVVHHGASLRTATNFPYPWEFTRVPSTTCCPSVRNHFYITSPSCPTQTISSQSVYHQFTMSAPSVHRSPSVHLMCISSLSTHLSPSVHHQFTISWHFLHISLVSCCPSVNRAPWVHFCFSLLAPSVQHQCTISSPFTMISLSLHQFTISPPSTISSPSVHLIIRLVPTLYVHVVCCKRRGLVSASTIIGHQLAINSCLHQLSTSCPSAIHQLYISYPSVHQCSIKVWLHSIIS